MGVLSGVKQPQNYFLWNVSYLHCVYECVYVCTYVRVSVFLIRSYIMTYQTALEGAQSYDKIWAMLAQE